MSDPDDEEGDFKLAQDNSSKAIDYHLCSSQKEYFRLELKAIKHHQSMESKKVGVNLGVVAEIDWVERHAHEFAQHHPYRTDDGAFVLEGNKKKNGRVYQKYDLSVNHSEGSVLIQNGVPEAVVRINAGGERQAESLVYDLLSLPDVVDKCYDIYAGRTITINEIDGIKDSKTENPRLTQMVFSASRNEVNDEVILDPFSRGSAHPRRFGFSSELSRRPELKQILMMDRQRSRY